RGRGSDGHAAAPALRGAVGARALDRRPRGRAGLQPPRGTDRRPRHRALDRGLEEGAVNGRPSELRATYRLQLTSSFGFAAARALVPYLRDLGISHLYLSPSFQARPGSTHGYDVIDPRRVSEDLGGSEELRALSGVARDAGMGVILD